MKRKRRAKARETRQSKRPKIGDQDEPQVAPKAINHPVLSQVYKSVITLRQYIISKLPDASKQRRGILLHLGRDEENQELGRLLDSTLIGAGDAPEEVETRRRSAELQTFSQELTDSTARTDIHTAAFQQDEIVSFVIWLLFKRKTLSIRPAHLLCHGLQQPVPTGIEGPDITTASSIPGVFSVSPNDNVAFLKGQPWNDLLAHLKTGGDHIMINLLLDCGVFVPVDAKGGNYLQVSGAPIFMVNSQFHISGGAAKGKTHPSAVSGPFNTPSSIRFVRSRMFYARCTLNSAGGVRFGLRHIHVFNRYPNASDASQTAHVMKYMFPRQHGLHNAFTSRVDPKETAMPFKDYTLREHEIKRWEMNQPFKPKTGDKPPTPKLPKRLRGSCFDIVRQVRKRHRKCSYVELLRHYCPAPLSDGSSKMINQAGDGDIVESATPAAHVSAFCRSVMRTVFPRSFFGDPGTDAAAHNETHVNVFVDNFISLRKFESLALHDLLEGLKVSSIPWLRSPKSKATERIAKSDFEARKSLLAEAMYFLIDGYLIPLIRSNFHVTESNNHRNRLFYFRHDIWRAISEPAMLELKSNLFEELLPDTAKSGTLTRRTATTAELRTMSQTKSMLCYSQIRLLPKSSGFRMITNLRRRMPIRQGGRLVLGKSINSFLTPAFNVMNYEKASQSVRLGASLFSVNDIFTRLKEFKSQLQDENLFGRPLYFAKVDVKSCFDTIPQDKAMQLIESLLSSEEYSVGKYAELKAADSHAYDSHGRSSAQGDSAHTKPRAKFASYGKAAEGAPDFKAIVASDLAATKRNTVFTRAGAPVIENRLRTLAVLREHITRNVVKIGKKRYRQKTGIPQGSVVSALLCNFFYGKFEHDRLAWLTGRSDTLLMRLIDDFLVVGTEKNAVERFVSEMHCGDADFGVQVKQEKTLMNFEMQPDEGAAGGKVWKEHAFPYCGLSIDSRSLGVRKDYENKGSKALHDSLTVEHSKLVGRTFHRKCLNALKIQLHTMLLDTSFNSLPIALSNLYQAFSSAANRCYAYATSLPGSRRPADHILIKTVSDLVTLAYALIRKRSARGATTNAEPLRRNEGYECRIRKIMATWTKFQKKQTGHAPFLAWLSRNLTCSPFSATEMKILKRAAGMP